MVVKDFNSWECNLEIMHENVVKKNLKLVRDSCFSSI